MQSNVHLGFRGSAQQVHFLYTSVQILLYLGVSLQKSLNWNNHIDQVAKKANSARAFLQRNIYQCPRQIKKLYYKTLVRPITEYTSVISDQFTVDNIRKLEMVQRRSVRFVVGDYRTTNSVTEILNQLTPSANLSPILGAFSDLSVALWHHPGI